jgi:hypothetical protein
LWGVVVPHPPPYQGMSPLRWVMCSRLPANCVIRNAYMADDPEIIG